MDTSNLLRAGCSLLLLLGAGAARADSSPSPSAPFAWGEAIGWVNFNTGTVTLTDSVMSGFAYSESTGWINLGDGSPDSPPYYSNASGTDFGVNNDGGLLSGYAWSESLGWINFDTFAASGQQVTVDGTGQMQGFVWSESAGWISMNCGYGVLLVSDVVEGEGEGVIEGTPEGTPEGIEEGIVEGTPEGIEEGIVEGLPEGIEEGVVEGDEDGEGVEDGEGEPSDDEIARYLLLHFVVLDIDVDALLRFTELETVLKTLGVLQPLVYIEETDTNSDGGLSVGELRQMTPDSPVHGGDVDGDGKLDLTELLRGIQFYNAGRIGCSLVAGDSEDGYQPGEFLIECRPHSADYSPQDWILDLSEVLRLIQLFNLQDIVYCPGTGEDGFCIDD